MDTNLQSESPRPSGLLRFWRELRRRKVVRVAMTYVVTGWIIIQVASATFEDFGIPAWAFRFVVLMVSLGFPLAVILAWAFELTPDGIRTTKVAREEHRDSDLPQGTHRRRNWMAYGLGAFLPTLIFGSLALYFYIRAPAPEVAAETASFEALEADTEEPEKSIAVLPLENLSPDPDNAFFAAGVHEDILTNLSKIQALRVISRTSTAGYKDTTKKLREIGQELGVRYLVEGSVRRAGDRVRVTVQLIDAQTDDHLWAENYDRTLEDIFAIQSAIAKEIAGQLQAVISPVEESELEKLPTKNVEAYDLFLRFRELQDSPEPAGDEKIALLERAVELDPTYAEAWAQLSIECVWWWAVGRNRSDPSMLAKGHRALAEAERLSPNAAFIPRAKGAFAKWELQKPSEWERLLKEAVAIDPTYTTAYSYLSVEAWRDGDYYSLQRFAEAHLRVEPTSIEAAIDLSDAFMYRQLWDQARAVIMRGLSTNESNERFWRQLYYLDYLQFGDKEMYFERVSAATGNSSAMGSILRARFIKDYDTAIQLIGSLEGSEWLAGMYFDDLFEPINLNAALIYFLLEEEGNMVEEATFSKAFIKDILSRDPKSKDRYRNDLAICHAMLGELGEAQALMDEQRQHLTSNRHALARFEIDQATVHLVSGDKDAAIASLARAFEARPDLPFKREMDIYYLWDPLRGDPRFEALLE